ncbi:hypothetical protein DN752_06010 [Echinicola strongylocentroti]|uniref:HTH luxR-type domain-containing protein n=1 Tax=Echinicola strongylocentroti TaxID=1795355 RepID=A0A2Z4IFI5_9BACT|nr:hypothetical protein [Echinicola strongylocentroti]AWW29714.1 hypothetical protein DN752_06010 [Echinicola strongylocentroti]
MNNLVTQNFAVDATQYLNTDPRKDLKALIEKGDLYFLSEFNEIYPNFITMIKNTSSKLNAMDIKFCVLLRMGFCTKEIARITKSTIRAVQSRKYRIRRRLNVPNEEDLNLFMVTFS